MGVGFGQQTTRAPVSILRQGRLLYILFRSPAPKPPLKICPPESTAYVRVVGVKEHGPRVYLLKN